MTMLLTALKHWKWIGLGLLALLVGILYVQREAAENRAERAKINLNECRKGREDDRKAYQDAQRKAAELNRADVERIVGEQEKKSAEEKSRYERDLARLRAGGVRRDLAAPKGSAGSPKAGSVPETACRDDAENLCVSRARVLQAAEIELGRNALIDWINEQLKVAR